MMKGKYLTQEIISDFKENLILEERSAATVEKYIRDVKAFAGCVNGVQWFKDRGQWMDGSAEPVPGMIIFFDWDNKGSSGPQDELSDHVGIVQKVENGIVYTVEGNSGDSCRVKQYPYGRIDRLAVPTNRRENTSQRR